MENDLAASRATSSEQITSTALEAISGAAGTRAGDILAAVIRHAHDLAREIRLEPGELLAAADFLKRCGDVSNPARHEYILLADVLGLTMVVDTEAADVADDALETSVLGPFYRAGSPREANGANISRGVDDGEPAHVHGRVLDTSGTPVSYPIPDDGPVGELLALTGRHNMRPAHLHFIASAEGYRTIVTELYTDDDPYVGSDAVFGVKPSLVVRYDRIDDPGTLRAAGRTEPYWDLEYDFVLAPGDSASVRFSTGRQPDY